MKADTPKALKTQALIATIFMVVGILLMTFTITTESEPGALPLLLVVVGTGWYIITRFRLRSHNRA